MAHVERGKGGCDRLAVQLSGQLAGVGQRQIDGLTCRERAIELAREVDHCRIELAGLPSDGRLRAAAGRCLGRGADRIARVARLADGQREHCDRPGRDQRSEVSRGESLPVVLCVCQE